MQEKSNNKTIAKNTIFLYFRMFVSMVITLYTSRVILQKLGIDDYGLYQAVGGVVGFLSFINNALSTATSRFITYALGRGDGVALKKTFATTLITHVLIGLIIVFIAETIGLWYVNSKMVIPDERFEVALVVYHISILTAFISIIQVPFYAEVIAHEKMSIFAYIGIIEAICKLGIVFCLSIGTMDRLVLYATLLLLVHIGIFVYYIGYCRNKFNEVVLSFSFDKKLFMEIFGFSGWSLFANGAIAFSNQGILLLLNLFFAPAVVAARSISLQVNNVANLFVQNFRTAANPQIVKRLASGDFNGSKYLLIESTKYSYYLMLIIALPLCLLSKPLLNLWLIEVPPYTVIFLQIVVVQSLFQVFDTSFYTALYAKGRIRENALISPLIGFLCFPIVYLLFVWGFSPVALSWAYLIAYALLGLLVKPILIHRIANYPWSEILDVFRVCFIVTIISVPLPIIVFCIMGVTSFIECLIVFCSSICSVAIAVWVFGMTKAVREELLQTTKRKFNIRG